MWLLGRNKALCLFYMGNKCPRSVLKIFWYSSPLRLVLGNVQTEGFVPENVPAYARDASRDLGVNNVRALLYHVSRSRQSPEVVLIFCIKRSPENPLCVLGKQVAILAGLS